MRVLVSGPPAAGKSTLAKRIADHIHGSLIDFDLIAQELGSTDRYDHDRAIAERAQQEVERRIADLGNPGSAVVIRSVPDRGSRETLAKQIAATWVIVLPVDADTAKARAAADDRPGWTAAAIDRWWSRYEPSDLDMSVEQAATLPGGGFLRS